MDSDIHIYVCFILTKINAELALVVVSLGSAGQNVFFNYEMNES